MASTDPAPTPAYRALLVLSGLFSLAAILTLIPNPGASWPNLWGYKSICPFAPGATIGCLLLALLSCLVRNRLVRRHRESAMAPALLAVVLAGLFAWASVSWLTIKSAYIDSTTSASTEK